MERGRGFFGGYGGVRGEMEREREREGIGDEGDDGSLDECVR